MQTYGMRSKCHICEKVIERTKYPYYSPNKEYTIVYSFSRKAIENEQTVQG